MKMYSLTYVSSATRLLSQEDLRNLLSTSRLNNERLGLTGMLLYKDGNFMQVLEGEQEAVLAVQARILEDVRHKGIIVLLRGNVPHRSFRQWSMAFRNLDEPSSRGTPGYDDFLNTPLTDARFLQNPAATQKLLHVFKKS
jgi:hypothetical protein